MQALGIGAAAVLGYSGKHIMNRGQQDGQGATQVLHRGTGTTVFSMQPSQGGVGLSNLLFAGALGAGAVMVLGGFQWLRRDDAVKRITPEIKKVENSALKQVRKADENSATRDKQLDQNNKLRLNKMETEIKGEGRANFDVLSQQIHCVTQIALQTLTNCSRDSTTAGGPGGEDIEKEREKLLEWTRKAQGEADKLVNPSNVSKARTFHVSSLRAEIPGLAMPGGEEIKEDVPISTGPNELQDARPITTEAKSSYWSLGLSCLGCTALLGSVYMFSSSGSDR